MKSAITVCLVPEARLGPFVYHTNLADGGARAAAAGFDAVEIFPPSAGAVERGELRSLLEKYGLKVAAIGTGAGWLVRKLALTSGEAKGRAEARGFIRE